MIKSPRNSNRHPDLEDLPDAQEPYDMEAFHEADSDAAEGEFVIPNV